jgi:hypothetical protein
MKRFNRTSLATAVGLAILGLAQVTEAQTFGWTRVVNNTVLVPACGDSNGSRRFNSYSQPSVNEAGLVAFRGRSKGSDGGGGEGEGELALAAAPGGETGPPARGIYVRDMQQLSPVSVVACVRGEVPWPNNLYEPGTQGGEVAGTFNEFPAFPRMDATSPAIATRGQSTPVWEYAVDIDPVSGEEETTRVGTAGVYVTYQGALLTGASLLGAAFDIEDDGSETPSFPEYSVPGAGIAFGSRFDQFPGSPTVADGSFVAFKGNFTVDDGETGVFFRDVRKQANRTFLVASSFTTFIPGSTTLFGSTAPPSAAGNYVFFVGSDNEDVPTLGGIYRARMNANAEKKLETLVSIGAQVPGELAGVGFARFGEGLSVSKDANLVSFWGTWGDVTIDKKLYCPMDGNKDIKAYCEQNAPYEEAASGRFYYVEKIPVNQGLFVYDVRAGTVTAVTKTGDLNGFSDFLYWVYSGAPPGVGGGHEGEGDEGEDREPPRWRSSAFAAVSLVDKKSYAVAFKATQDVPGIFLSENARMPVKVLKVGDEGRTIDPDAPAASVVTALGIERDGFRGVNLAITASMLDFATTESMSGIYLAKVR